MEMGSDEGERRVAPAARRRLAVPPEASADQLLAFVARLGLFFDANRTGIRIPMRGRDVILVVDVLDDFEHEDGAALLASFAERQPALAELLERARFNETPIVYANDNKGKWDGDVSRLVKRALTGPGGMLIRDVVPQAGDRFLVKPRYSAFDHTPLDLILGDLNCERMVIAGMTTEGCVAQTAIAARELDLKVSVPPDACATANPAAEEIALRYLVEVVGVHLQSVATGLVPANSE